MMYPTVTRVKRSGWVKNRVNWIHLGSKGSDHIRRLNCRVNERKGFGAVDPGIDQGTVCQIGSRLMSQDRTGQDSRSKSRFERGPLKYNKPLEYARYILGKVWAKVSLALRTAGLSWVPRGPGLVPP